MAIIATIVGLMVLAAAAHYYYTNSGYGQPTQYQESYKPPEYHWEPPPRHEYNYEDNSVDILPGPSGFKFTTEWESSVEKTTETLITTTLSSEPTTLSPEPTRLPPATSTLQETTSFHVSTDIPHSSSTRRQDNDIEYAVGAPNVVDIQTLKSKEFYKYKHNSESELDPDGSNTPGVEFHPLGHPIARDPVFRKTEIQREKGMHVNENGPSPPIEPAVASRAASKSLLGYFVTVSLIIVVILK